MRELRALLLLTAGCLVAGCGYIHFGRLPKGMSDPALESAYLDLSLQQKILRQELAIARKENETLRGALDRGGPAGESKTEISRQLETTTHELATLRASYAKLQAERTQAMAPNLGGDAVLAATREKLTAASHESAQLQQENAQLQRDLNAARSENAALASQLKSTLVDKEEAQAAARQLSSELVAAKEARAQAENATATLRAQLDAVVARAERAESAQPVSAAPAASEPARPTTTPAPNALSDLQAAKAPPSEAVPMVEIRTSLARARASNSGTGASTPPADPTPLQPVAATSPPPDVSAASVSTPTAPPAPDASRNYTVRNGDTLEKIAIQFYGAANEWGKIYAANVEALSASSGLKPGMELKIPPK